MTGWDDVRYFLALSWCGSVRAAGDQMGVSHSIVARRMETFEKDMGGRLFDGTPCGYVMTVAGEEMVEITLHIEEDMNSLERRLLGQDAKLAGRIYVTLADNLTSNFLMPFLVEFGDAYPDIDLEMILSYRALDLSKREADVAIRYYRIDVQPPDHLIGCKLASVHYVHYASPVFLDRIDLSKDPSDIHCTAWADEGRFPDWVKDSPYPYIPTLGC